MNHISVNGIDLAYERRGKGNPLVLIHGFPLDHTSWEDVALLLQDDFDLIIPDLRGFGESGSVDASYTVADMADDISGFLNNLGIEKAAFAGHSMGGYVALSFAKAYPQKVSGLGLVSSQALADSPERKAGRYKTAEDVAEKGVIVVADAMSSKLSPNADVQVYVRRVIERQGKSGVMGALKAMAEREDSSPSLSSFNFPVVLLHGAADVLIPVDRSREIKQIMPSAHLIELPEVGHMPMKEFPSEAANALMFLK